MAERMMGRISEASTEFSLIGGDSALVADESAIMICTV
jgi:hypothetical protein